MLERMRRESDTFRQAEIEMKTQGEADRDEETGRGRQR